jgi:glycosyltransferase involved in cell wall biosynthesis
MNQETKSRKEKKIAIFIVAYNAADTLANVIDRIPDSLKNRVKEIFVFDDFSKDSTYLIGVGYKKIHNLSNLHVYKNPKNLGYGGNQKKGYNYAISRGYDIVVMLHGDAQYAPEKIPSLLPLLENDMADMVFGSRMKGNPLKGGMPLWRFFGNKVLTYVENKVLGLNLSEFHSGFRSYSCRALRQIPFNSCSDGYDFDTDILIQFKLKGLRIAETLISTHYGKESHRIGFFSSVKYGLNILKSLYDYKLHVWKIKRVSKFNI